MKIPLLFLFISFLFSCGLNAQNKEKEPTISEFDQFYKIVQGFEPDLDVEPTGKFILKFVCKGYASSVRGKEMMLDNYVWTPPIDSWVAPNELKGYHDIQNSNDTIIDPVAFFEAQSDDAVFSYNSIGSRFLIIYFPFYQDYIGNETDYYSRITYYLERP